MAQDTKTSALEVVPLLWVKDMDQALGFYQKLGFKLTESWTPRGNIQWCRVEFHGATLMLQIADDAKIEQVQNPADNGIQLYFITDDVDLLYRQFRASGIDIKPPKVEFYGMKQVFVPDPDGRTLCFESVVPA